MTESVKCLIIGAGPAGYTAGIYASRAGLEPVLIEGLQPGGQLTITSDVENFPGYPDGSTGPQIMEDIRQQSINNGTKMIGGLVTSVDFSKRPFQCIVNEKTTFLADTVIIATGATARWLEIESEKKFKGFGVSACATCDGAFFVNKDVAVVGGGDTAVEEALYLAQRSKKVYLIHRRDQLRACKALQERVLEAPNIEILWNSIPKEILGEQQGFIRNVTGMRLANTVDHSEYTIAVDGIFVSIGAIPATEIFKDYITLDRNGYIKTKPGTPFTNIPGVFAAGDVQDPNYRQALTAAASGCMAGIEAERFLTLNADESNETC
ncbi:thioredoxin-disulfide reductase [Bacteroidales bacterium OttesenSCG-928-B11]|nr:thioredoxin-disulfide reductase [Bacteroidales bacterium OttesenSCG-928-B11]